MRALLALHPTTNYALASPNERADQMDQLARVLMGLSHPLQIVGQARPVDQYTDWPRPPRIERQWWAVVQADDAATLAWRTRTLTGALDGVGLRCSVTDETPPPPPTYGYADVQPDAVYDGHQWVSTLVLRRWPREVAPGWLGQALAGDVPVDVGIHVQPQNAERVARFLRRQQAWQSDANAARPDAANELGRTDAERVRQKLIARTDRPAKVAIALTVRSSDPHELRARTETLAHEIGLALGDARPATFEQDWGLEATQPTGRCRLLGAWRTLDCTSVASTWPFQPASVNHKNGAAIGTTHDGSMLVQLDPFDDALESFGGIVLAKVGSGKSYFLKLLSRRLVGVEVLIVEQRTPPEYAGVRGAQTLNLASVPYADRAAHLREFVANLWETARRDRRPRLLILDELWSLLRYPALAALIEEIARIGRHHYLSLWIATQQVTELLDDRGGKAVLDNAAIRVYLKQHDRDLEKLCDAVGLQTPARRFLRTAARGQALLDVGGMLVPVDIQATPDEHIHISTDPREGRHADVDSAAREDRGPGGGGLRVWDSGAGRAAGRAAPVAAAHGRV